MTETVSGMIHIDYSSVVDATAQARLLARGLTSMTRSAQSLNTALGNSIKKMNSLQLALTGMQGFVTVANNINTLSNALIRLSNTSITTSDNIARVSKQLTSTNRELIGATNSLSSAQTRLFKAQQSANNGQILYTRVVRNSTSSQNQATNAVNKSTKSKKRKAKSTQEATDKMEAFNLASRNLTKSVQVALGPLSGVAARITALTALFNANTLSAAGLISALVGLSVATHKIVGIGIEAERRYLRMIGITEVLGEKTKFTAKQLEDMSQTLAFNTLAGLDDVRDAFVTLSTYTEIAEGNFYKAAQAAQAMADVFGGSLKTNINQIGRLLEDPFRNMDALRRSGIQFSKEEQENIERLRRTFRTEEAQAIVLEKFNAAIEISKKQSMGLAGTIDTLGQKFQNLFERAAKESGALRVVNNELKKIIDAVDDFNNTGGRIMDEFGRTFERIAQVVVGGARIMAENVEILNMLFKLFLGVTIVRSAKALALFTANITGATAVVTLLAATLTTKAKLILGLSAAFVKFAIIAALVYGIYKFLSRETVNMNKDFDNLNKKIEETRNGLVGIPTEVAIKLSAEIDTAEASAKFAKETRDVYRDFISGLEQQLDDARVELSRKKRTFDSFSSFLGLEEIGSQETTQEMMKLIQTIRILESHIQLFTDTIRESDEAMDELSRQADEYRQAWERGFGDKTLGGVVTNLNELRQNFDTLAFNTEKYDNKIQELKDTMDGWYRINEQQRQQLRDAGFDIQNMIKLLGQMEEQSPRLRGLQDMVDVIEELGNEATNAERALQGLAAIDFSKKRFDIRVRDMGSEARAQITSMLGLSENATDKEITSLLERRQTNTERMLELSNEMESLRNKELSTLDRINKEYDDILDKISRVSGVDSGALTAEVEAARDRDVLKFRSDQYQKIGEMHLSMTDYINKNTLNEKEYSDMVARQAYADQLQMLNQFIAARMELEGGAAEDYVEIAKTYSERFAEAYANSIKVVSSELTLLQELGLETGKALENAFADFLFNPFEDGVKGMVRNFAIAMARVVSQALAAQIITGAFGGTSFGNFLGIPGKASGGYITGKGSGKSDSIPALLSNGEYVINANAVKKIGIPTLHRMNNFAESDSIPALLSNGEYVINANAVKKIGIPAPVPGVTGASGGYITGKGSGKSDSIPALLSNGEYVINANAVKKIGIPTLHKMNNFADGGLVGSGGMGYGGDITNNITVNVTDSGGTLDQKEATELSRKIEGAVIRVIINEKRPGGLLAA